MPFNNQHTKSEFRLLINLNLIVISFTIFALIISLNPELLRESFWVPVQLTLSIPILFSSIFARSRLAYSKKPKMWEEYGYATFLIGYSFLINVLTILLSVSIGLQLGLIFVLANVTMAVVYSAFEVVEDRKKLFSRFSKDVLFVTLLIFGGLVPSMFL